MNLRSVLLLFVLGLTAYDFTFSMPVELVDLEHMKTSIVDSSKAAEIIDNKESDVEDDSSDAEEEDYSEEEDPSKKEYVADSPDVSAVATEGEESPTKKESVLDVTDKEASSALVSEAKKAKDSGDDAGKLEDGSDEEADVPSAADKKYRLVPINPYYGGWGLPFALGNRGYGVGYGYGSRRRYGYGYGLGYGYGYGRRYGHGYGIGPGVGYWPGSYGFGLGRHGFAHAGGCIGGLYRDVIHKGSKKTKRRCLFGKIGRPLGDEQDSASSRQGVVYPYVGYGPWASYPWWADWWGGHGHHGWGSHGRRYGGHHVYRGGIGHFGLGGGYGHGVGFHCRDIVPNGKDDEDSKGKGKSKRFCVPIGYHGGYGWPFWHGYPGAGLGMFGWGWPWYKSKVPKGEKATSVETKKAGKSNDKDEKKDAKDLKSTQHYKKTGSDHKAEKKQTIHVGYGYASGDNYRLGYGMGGMGGVNSFSGGAQPIEAQVAGGHGVSGFKKSVIPVREENSPLPENVKEVTATKRQLAAHQNGAGFGNSPGTSSVPVTHPGFTTMSWPGHAVTTPDFKNKIPKGPLKVKRQAFGAPEGFGGMVPMQEQTPDLPFPQGQGPEMMVPSRFADQPSAGMSPAPSNGYPEFERDFIPKAPKPNFAPEQFSKDDSMLY